MPAGFANKSREPIDVQLTSHSSLACQRIRVSGIVQGVGFRPTVWRLAKALGLTGWVRTDPRGVEIEVCGERERIEALIEQLRQDAPPMARIDAITSRFAGSVSVSDDFYILDSRGGRATTMIGPDMAVCRECLAEMFDPENRRWRYALIDCMHCGPRYSVCNGLPFEREQTSYKPFKPCRKCSGEYRRLHGRRAHAEITCCPKCGPQLQFLDASGKEVAGDAIASALQAIRRGEIVAVKGTGGFHLFADARNADAVARLRKRKRRPAKPFPVMFANTRSAIPYVQFKVGEPGLLTSAERPIILLNKRRQSDESLPGIAPDLPRLGVILPFAPVHYLLFHEAAGRPAGLDWLDQDQELVLLMSSANPEHEPIAIGNDEAVTRLAGIADAFLVHGADIVTRCDDSIAYSGSGSLQLLRRGRGHAPAVVKLPQAGPPVLAVGGLFGNAVCVTRGDEAFLSQHLGELSNPAALNGFEETIRHLLKMLDVSPTLIAHDLHRDVFSYAPVNDMARQRTIPMLAVQHHHAHVAAVLAEYSLSEPIFGLVLDSGEIGTDGSLWGGELLWVDGARFERRSHLVPIGLAGLSEAGRTPWRLAAAVLHHIGRGDEIARRFSPQTEAKRLAAQLATDTKKPVTSSLGCLFDAAAAILGFVQTQAFQTQAGLLMEGAAEDFGTIEPLSDGWWMTDDGLLDLSPLFTHLLAEIDSRPDARRGAALFFSTAAAAVGDWLRVQLPAGSRVAISGSCLQNRFFARELRFRIGQCDLQVLEARRAPPNDGNLALGQAWIAQHYLLEDTPPS